MTWPSAAPRRCRRARSAPTRAWSRRPPPDCGVIGTAMYSQKKVIITCAVTGAIHTPSMSPHLPITAQEIADAAVAAREAGAAIVHLHARDPQTGKPDQRPAAFEPF